MVLLRFRIHDKDFRPFDDMEEEEEERKAKHKKSEKKLYAKIILLLTLERQRIFFVSRSYRRSLFGVIADG